MMVRRLPYKKKSLLCPINEYMETKVKSTQVIPFSVPQNMKYLGVNFLNYGQDLCSENNAIMKRKIKRSK